MVFYFMDPVKCEMGQVSLLLATRKLGAKGVAHAEHS